jgi:hypothetical protein
MSTRFSHRRASLIANDASCTSTAYTPTVGPIEESQRDDDPILGHIGGSHGK